MYHDHGIILPCQQQHTLCTEILHMQID